MAKAQAEKAHSEMVLSDDRPTCFYKIMRGQTLERLRIPPCFTKYLWKEVLEKMVLEDPSGNLWTVSVHKKGKYTYLEDGWPEFVRHHLGNDEFVLFTYDGSLCFHVNIFDRNGLERLGTLDTCEKQHQEVGSSKKRKPGRPAKNKEAAAASSGKKKVGRPKKE